MTLFPVMRYIAGELEVNMLFGLCMTLNKDQTETVVGACPFNFRRRQYLSFLAIPSHPSHLDAAVCGFTKRTGQLCGQCVNGTSPPVYFYFPQCVKCSTSNWAKYLTVSLLSTTVFFLGAVALRLRATAPHMNGFILFCQILTSPPLLREIVTLHYYNCRLVVCLWRPFLKCCIHFRRQWNIQSSLVDTFATFLLLSYVKFLSVSFDILAPTFMYNKWDRHIGTVLLYYDGSVEYFGADHLPYAVLAITVLLVFTVLPILLLCLYPCRWFQKFTGFRGIHHLICIVRMLGTTLCLQFLFQNSEMVCFTIPKQKHLIW